MPTTLEIFSFIYLCFAANFIFCSCSKLALSRERMPSCCCCFCSVFKAEHRQGYHLLKEKQISQMELRHLQMVVRQFNMVTFNILTRSLEKFTCSFDNMFF